MLQESRTSPLIRPTVTWRLMLAQQSEERAFDVIPFEDIQGDWKKLGSGSFGNVYKGVYLGIDVAIKEVLPSTEYDVSKYFEREWRLMKEARHPNVVLYLGLSKAPSPDGRIFIISEYIENGNLRMYIHDKNKPFPWRLRLSFATDIARALAYLHARKCIHRDLKGENLLVTANGRLKITDFGFARIAARNAEESRRLTFCGTDSYMSPEILRGDEFGLSTDIFSLGVILCEIAARKLADDDHFKRTAPGFGIDADEVHNRASPGCPPAFISLALDCLGEDPAARPNTIDILSRLRAIELEVLARPSEADDVHVGSVKFMTGNKRPGPAPRIPSFGMGVAKDIRTGSHSSDEDSDEELMEAIKGLEFESAWSGATAGHGGSSQQPLVDNTDSSMQPDYSTTVIRSHSPQATTTMPPSLSSILTIRSPKTDDDGVLPTTMSMVSMASIESYHTAHSTISIAAATEGGSTIRASPSALVHRFTLIKPGAKRTGLTPSTSQNYSHGGAENGGIGSEQVWNPFDFFFTSGLVSKCDLCTKRLGWKPVLECDDCGLRAHIKCGELAPMDCGLRPMRPHAAQTFISSVPLSKAKQNAKSPTSGASSPR